MYPHQLHVSAISDLAIIRLDTIIGEKKKYIYIYIMQYKKSQLSEPVQYSLTFRHRASCILGQAFRYSPENAFYIFNQHIYFII